MPEPESAEDSLEDSASLDGKLDKELRPYFKGVFIKLHSELTWLPAALAIKNLTSSGVRDLHVEMTVPEVRELLQVSHQVPRIRSAPGIGATWDYGIVLSGSFGGGEPSETERKLQRLVEKGVTKEGGEWKYSFDWDALQPQRTRLLEPFTFVQVVGSCKIVLKAKVYADSFPRPIELQAEMTVNAKEKPIPADLLIEQAKKLREEAEKQPRYTTSNGVINLTRPFTGETTRFEDFLGSDASDTGLNS